MTLDDPNRPDWQVDFFTGVPAPAGALLALLPVYLGLLGVERYGPVSILSDIYLLFVAFLMVSTIPTWSGKRAGRRISRTMVLPIMVGVMMLVALLFSYPWVVLTVVCLAYLATIPFSYRDFNRRRNAAS